MQISAGREWRWIIALLVLGVTGLVVFFPHWVSSMPRRQAESFLPPAWYSDANSENRYVLGTDYLGRSFASVLVTAMSSTTRIALLGTVAVLLGVLLVGAVHGSTQSRALGSLLAAGNVGAMAVPEAAVLITIAAAWPRIAPPWQVNASMVAVLVAFAIPPGARLVAERIRSVNRSGFVAASRACGATYAHTFRYDVWPHLIEDVAWITASVLPRFVAIEVGLSYLGVEYREFDGLGRTLAKSFSNVFDGVAQLQMLVTMMAVLWVALIPQVILRVLGVRAWRSETE